MVGSPDDCQKQVLAVSFMERKKKKKAISVKADSWQKSQHRKIKVENPTGCKSQQLNCRNQITQITMAKACGTNLIKWIMQDNNADRTVACCCFTIRSHLETLRRSRLFTQWAV